METNDITEKIIGACMSVHSALGPGLFEKAYQECLKYELELPLVYKEIKLDKAYRVDLLVENKIILELKSVEKLTDVHLAQILTYLRLSKMKTGLLLNFNVKSMRQGIKRVVI